MTTKTLYPWFVLAPLLLSGCFLFKKTHPSSGDGGGSCPSPMNPCLGIPAAGSCDASQNVAPIACTVGSSTALPTALAGAMATVAGSWVYVAGGTTTGNATVGSRSVYVNSVNSDGSLGSTWKAVSALPVAIYQAGFVSSHGFLYVLGGETLSEGNNTPQATVYFAQINNSDGTLVAPTGSEVVWQTGPALPTPRGKVAAVALNGFLYSLGGNTANAQGGEDDSSGDSDGPVYFSQIQSDGAPGPWQSTQPLYGSGRASLGAAGTNYSSGRNYIYVVGGRYVSSGEDCEPNKVLVGPINSDGSIAGWGNATPFTSDVEAGGAAIVDDTLFVLGGRGSDFMFGTGAILAANLGPEGNVTSDWTQVASLPNAGFEQAITAGPSTIYAFGGIGGSTSAVLFGTSAVVPVANMTVACPH
jgi:hypothetical protein